MPVDSQGNPRSGFGRMKAAETSYASKKPTAVKPMEKVESKGKAEKPGGEEHMHAHSHKGGEHDISEMSIHDAVKKHGPAEHVMAEHDHEEGMHHVHTVHGEKHHHSDHDTAEAAHEHMGHALGVDAESEEGEAEPYGGEETPDEEAAEAKSSAIPGLK